MIRTIGKVLLVCSIFSSWAFASEYRTAVILRSAPEKLIQIDLRTYQSNYQLEKELRAIGESSLLSKSKNSREYSIVLFVEEEFERIVGYSNRAEELFDRLVTESANVGKTVTSLILVKCPKVVYTYQKTLYGKIQEEDPHTIFLSASQSSTESIGLVKKSILNKFKEYMLEICEYGEKKLVRITHFTSTDDKKELSINISTESVLETLKKEFWENTPANTRIRTYIIFVTDQTHTTLSDNFRVRRLIGAHTQFSYNQGLVPTIARYVLVTYPRNVPRNNIANDIIAATEGECYECTVATVVYDENAKMNVDQLPVTEFIRQRIRE